MNLSVVGSYKERPYNKKRFNKKTSKKFSLSNERSRNCSQRVVEWGEIIASMKKYIIIFVFFCAVSKRGNEGALQGQERLLTQILFERHHHAHRIHCIHCIHYLFDVSPPCIERHHHAHTAYIALYTIFVWLSPLCIEGHYDAHIAYMH